jgi:hypothetical protein
MSSISWTQDCPANVEVAGRGQSIAGGRSPHQVLRLPLCGRIPPDRRRVRRSIRSWRNPFTEIDTSSGVGSFLAPNSMVSPSLSAHGRGLSFIPPVKARGAETAPAISRFKIGRPGDSHSQWRRGPLRRSHLGAARLFRLRERFARLTLLPEFAHPLAVIRVVRRFVLARPSAVVAEKKSIGRQVRPPARIVTSQAPTAPRSPLIKAIPAIAHAFVRVSDIGTQAEAIPVITRVSPPKTTAVPAPDRHLGGGGHYCCGRQRRDGDGEQSDLTHYRSPLPASARATQSITGQRQKAIAQLANCPRGRRCRRRP